MCRLRHKTKMYQVSRNRALTGKGTCRPLKATYVLLADASRVAQHQANVTGDTVHVMGIIRSYRPECL